MIENGAGFYPLGRRLLVLPDVVEQKTSSGIVLSAGVTASEENAQIRGRVVALGQGCWADLEPDNWPTVGDRIVFGKYAGMYWAGNDGQKYRVLNDQDVIGVFFGD